MEFYPQGGTSQISHFFDKIKISFAIFLQSSPSYNTEPDRKHRKQALFILKYTFKQRGHILWYQWPYRVYNDHHHKL